MIVPYFGPYPEWFDLWMRNTERMRNFGYDFLFDTDEQDFQKRVWRTLGIECPPMTGTGRVWNFRPALGVLYEEEIADFDFWGHTDFDCVYGQVEKWVTDEFLDGDGSGHNIGVDIHSNHDNYICGPWTLYSNTPVVNNLFRRTDEWKERMEGDDWSHGWAEKGFTQIVDQAHLEEEIVRKYTKWQTRSQDDFSTCVLHEDGRLTEGGTECMMLHFRRTKEYPSGCVLTP